MKLAFVILLVLHGAIHWLGFAKGFHWAALPQLQLPISRAGGLVWLAASTLLLAGALALLGGSRHWGVLALLGVVVSQVLIAGQFKDAKYGTLANALILLPAALSALDLRPSSLRSSYERAVAELRASVSSPATKVEARELAHLPDPVRRYLERAGVVGRPRVVSIHVAGSVKMRRTPNEDWMPSTMDQYSTLTDLRRLFFMQAQKGPISFDVYHQFTGGEAYMQARVLGLWPVVDAAGPELTQSETVTVLNDMCLLAPASLIDSRLEWESIDDSRSRVWLHHAGHRVGAELHFNTSGELTNFVSSDRFQSDGTSSRLVTWSTPVTGYRDVDGRHLPSTAEAQWQEATGLWTYAQFTIELIAYDPAH